MASFDSRSAIRSLTGEAMAAGGKVGSTAGSAPERYVCYPGTEELKPDAIRLFAWPSESRRPGATKPRHGGAATSGVHAFDFPSEDPVI